MSPRIAVITNVIPSYRAPFYDRVVAAIGDKLRIYCQTSIPGMNLHVCHQQFVNNVRKVRCWSTYREKIAWQWLPLVQLLREHDVYVFTGNPRILSTLVLATLLRLIGRPVVIWGQLHTAGAKPCTEKLRLLWWRMFRHILLYTDAEALKMRKLNLRRHNVIGINNGLDQQRIDAEKNRWDAHRLAIWQKNHDLNSRTVLLSCARLEPKNQFSIMLEALADLVKTQSDLLWVVIGDGSEREYLQKKSVEKGLENHILWLGALHDEEDLAPWFLTAKIFVHPGAIGLSLMHAFGYGLPVVTHYDANRHMPEFSAMPEEAITFCFEPDSSAALAISIQSLLSKPTIRDQLSSAALATTRRFNVDVMADRFLAICEQAYIECKSVTNEGCNSQQCVRNETDAL
jgi:glycosyltransferase involved in cell wall biosynthesis